MMSDEALEQKQGASAAANEADRPLSAAESVGESSQERAAGSTAKLVPVNEAIKYRRRAQQAESKLQQFEQQLKDLQAQLESRLEQLATAEAQRDELQHQLSTSRIRSEAERMLYVAGVNDVETAIALLEKRKSFSEELEPKQLKEAVDQLLQDKPFLATSRQALPDKTASQRIQNAGANSRLARAAAQAANSGNRRDVAQYLRLRRQANTAY